MFDYVFLTKSTDCEAEKEKEYDNTRCTNPISDAEEVKKISWLDDYGWI